MGTKVKFSPVYGAHSEDPLCYLLQVDEFKILLDCGWDETLDMSLLEPLTKIASQVDAVLLSFPDITHLGALPYAYGKLGLVATVYCTEPVRKLGTMVMYDLYQSLWNVSDAEVFSLDDVDEAFENTISLKFSQPQAMGDKGSGITITPYAAGRLLGGTIWKITKDSEDIIYAVDYNHRIDKHLDGSVLQTFSRPTVLITSASSVLTVEPKKKQRDADFFQLLLQTLRNGGHVLLPTDSAGRVLEILLYIDQYLAQHKLPYPFVFLSPMAANTLKLAKSYLEWMGESVTRGFESSRENPFLLKNVTICHDVAELATLASPRVVLATSSTLQVGPARKLFVDMASDHRNLVLFTQTAEAGSLAALLMSQPTPPNVELKVSERVALEGEELEEYLVEKERKRKEEEEEEKAKAAAAVGDLGQSGAEGLKTGGTEDMNRGKEDRSEAMNVEYTPAPASPSRQKAPRVLTDGFVSTTKFPMFPAWGPPPSARWDAYGEVIDVQKYVRNVPEGGSIGASSAAFMESTLVDAMDEDLEVLPNEIPSKIVETNVMVDIACSVRFLDFEGRSDGRSVKTILKQVSPLKLILIHGSEAATENLRLYCKREVCPFVYAPKCGDWLDVTSDLSTFKVLLTDELLQNVTFKQLGEYEVAWVDGQAGPTADMALPLTPRSDNLVQPHHSVFVGDLRLSDFKGLLKSNGVNAEFGIGGGLLRCGDSVSIRKTSDHRVIIEGALSQEYYKIRGLLYSQFFVL